MSDNKILIIGGGQSAAYASQEIRKNDLNSKISIITSENYYPYERPPLSKGCLLGNVEYRDCEFFPEKFYQENNIDIKKNTYVEKVNFEKNIVIDSSENIYDYNTLLITTGSKNRLLNVNEKNIYSSDNIIYLRDIPDSKNIKEKIITCQNPIIIGGGFIGLEIAAAISQMGKKLVLIEKSKQLMGRIIPKEIADIIKEKHENSGVKIFLNSDIIKFEEEGNNINISLNNGEILTSDLVIIGVGSVANTSIFNNTDLNIDNGIIVDQYCRTSIQNVFASGDVANFFHPHYKKYIRLESYKHAQNHGIIAAKNICGLKETYNDIPWMWSDQYDFNLQLSGLCDDYDDIVVRGDNVEEGKIYFFLKNNIIRGACGVAIGGKVGKNIRLASKLSEKNTIISSSILSDKSSKLNKYL